MKTAVEYLVEQLLPKALSAEQYYHIEQAKEMEKQQIIDANRNGVDMVIDNKKFITGEQYYNKTFKKDEN